jgi:NhaP-type Na+/H+ or K+/H+ antiporter
MLFPRLNRFLFLVVLVFSRNDPSRRYRREWPSLIMAPFLRFVGRETIKRAHRLRQAHERVIERMILGAVALVFFSFTFFFASIVFCFWIVQPAKTHATMHAGREEKVIMWWGASRGGVKNVLCVWKGEKKSTPSSLGSFFFKLFFLVFVSRCHNPSVRGNVHGCITHP